MKTVPCPRCGAVADGPRGGETSSSTMRRVVITGLGTVNALGADVKTSWPRMLAGENGVGPITKFPVEDMAVRFAASVDWNPEGMFSVPDLRKLDPFTMFALKATDEAFADAGLDPTKVGEELRENWGAIVGTGIGGITGIVDQHTEMIERGPRSVLCVVLVT